MRKLIFTALVGAALLIIAPVSAMARDHHRSRAHHHRSHQVRTHFRRFGSRDVTSSGTPSGDSAGTVTSFSDHILTITLADGSQVRGRVTDATEVACSSGMSTMSHSDNGDSGDDPSGDDRSGDSGGSGDNGGDQGDDPGDDAQGEDNGGEQSCSTSALKAGTVVAEAELKVSSGGATWDKLELVTQ